MQTKAVMCDLVERFIANAFMGGFVFMLCWAGWSTLVIYEMDKDVQRDRALLQEDSKQLQAVAQQYFSESQALNAWILQQPPETQWQAALARDLAALRSRVNQLEHAQ